MRLIYVVPFFSWPARDGFSIRLWNAISHLSRRNDIDLVVQSEEVSSEMAEDLRDVVRTISAVPSMPRRAQVPQRFPRLTTVVDTLQYPPRYFTAVRGRAAHESCGGVN